MIFSNQLSKSILLTLALSIAVFSTANAAVMEHVETEEIGLVINHAVSPDGKFIVSTTISPDGLFVHSRDPNTGELLEQLQKLEAKDFINGLEPSFHPQGITFSPDSKQVYIGANFGIPGNTALNFGGSLLRFDISTAGELTYINRVLTEGAEYGPTITSDGKFMYLGSTGARARVTAINREANGNISKIQTIKTDLNSNELQNSEHIRISPDNKNLYVSSVSFDAHLYVFDINSDGSLTSKKTFIHENKASTTWAYPEDIAITGSGGSGTAFSRDGKFFYSVGGYGDDNSTISIFSRSNDGSLSFLKNVSGNIGSNRLLFAADSILTISNDQKFIYTHDDIEDNISVWRRNLNTGDLTFVRSVENNSPVYIDSGAEHKLALSNDGKNLYLNSAGGIVVFDLRTDLSLVKTDSIDPINTSGTIDYTLAITNESGTDAQNVVITDTLPAGASFVSGSVNSSTGSCSANGQTVTCTMGEVLSSEAYNAAIKVKAPTTEGQITNTATVTSDQLDKNIANKTDTETTNINSGDTSTPSTPSSDDESSGGGSMPLEFLLMLVPLFLRRKRSTCNN